MIKSGFPPNPNRDLNMTYYKSRIKLLFVIIITSLTGCSEARMDPCELLSVDDVKELDSTVSISLWAGRGGKKKEDEVCMFYTDKGDPRVMLFVWYDKDKTPRDLVTKGEKDLSNEIVDLDIPGKEAVASFSENNLKLLAVKSSNGIIGLRVRNSIKKDSDGFDTLLDLSGKALSKIR
jgi:hypothetical protein